MVDLIRQRVPLLDWKMLGQFEDTHHKRHRRHADTPTRSSPRSRNAPLAFDEPPVCLVNHFNDLAEDLIVGVIKFVKDLLVQVAMSISNLDMDLGFRGFRLRITKLRNEGSTMTCRRIGVSACRRIGVRAGTAVLAWRRFGVFVR